MVKLFDEYGIQFVSVTQEINTATSSGRMFLNILMTFAQYEREIISERTRDKLFMSRQNGMYTSGMTVLGYKAVNKKLEIVPEEAEIVKFIFRRYIEIQSPKHIARELNAQNITTKNGFKWNRNRVNVILNNYVYNGKIFYHHQTVFDGEHEAIIDDDTWNRTREIMKANANSNDLTKRTRQDIPMRGKAFCGHCDKAFIPSYSKKKTDSVLLLFLQQP